MSKSSPTLPPRKYGIHVLSHSELEDVCQLLRDLINAPDSIAAKWDSEPRSGGSFVYIEVKRPKTVVGIVMDIDNFNVHKATSFVPEEILDLLSSAERKLSKLKYCKTQAERSSALVQYSDGLGELYQVKDRLSEIWSLRENELPSSCQVVDAFAFELPLEETTNAR
jgi:hypothetical protein